MSRQLLLEEMFNSNDIGVRIKLKSLSRVLSQNENFLKKRANTATEIYTREVFVDIILPFYEKANKYLLSMIEFSKILNDSKNNAKAKSFISFFEYKKVKLQETYNETKKILTVYTPYKVKKFI